MKQELRNTDYAPPSVQCAPRLSRHKGTSPAREKRMRQRYVFKPNPEVPPNAFTCGRCNQVVPGLAPGTEHRNHCPLCLWSLHVDMHAGDRRSGCRGLMEPIALWVRRGGEWSIVHRCQQCGILRANRIAGDDNELALMSLAVRPLAQPPFPLDRLDRGSRNGQR